MKKVFAVLFTVGAVVVSFGQCYQATDTNGVIFGNRIGQHFDACADGNVITIETMLGRWPIASAGDSLYIFNQAGDTIGKGSVNISLNQVQIQGGVLSSELQTVQFSVECSENFIIGNQYRWQVQITGPDYYDAQWVGYWSMQLYAHLCNDIINGSTYSATTDYYGTEYALTSEMDILATVTISDAPDACFGDCDGDNHITVADLICLVSQFGSFGSGMSMDLNNDESVDINDVAIFVSIYGTYCE